MSLDDHPGTNRMRAVRFLVRAGLLASLGPLVFLGAACSKEVKADFPRPPASAAIEPKEEPPVPVTTAETPEPVEEVAATPPTLADPEPEEPAEPRPARRRAASPPKPAPADPPPSPPPSPQLARSEAPAGLVAKLERAERLLAAVDGRRLSREREEQRVAARAFLAQARAALDDGDERRAVVLIDKAVILAEDVERASRP